MCLWIIRHTYCIYMNMYVPWANCYIYICLLMPTWTYVFVVLLDEFYLWCDLIPRSRVKIYVGKCDFILYVYTFLLDDELHPMPRLAWFWSYKVYCLIYFIAIVYEIVDGYICFIVVLAFIVLCQKWQNKDVQSINQYLYLQIMEHLNTNANMNLNKHNLIIHGIGITLCRALLYFHFPRVNLYTLVYRKKIIITDLCGVQPVKTH